MVTTRHPFLRLISAITVENLGQAMMLVALPMLVIERYGLGTELTTAGDGALAGRMPRAEANAES